MKIPSSEAVEKMKYALLFIGLLPLMRLGLLFYLERLGANPIEFITRSTGTWTLVVLLCTLAVTPLRVLTGLVWLLRFRRLLGLLSFFYVCLHLLTYLWFDQFFDWTAILQDIAKRPFITLGLAAFLIFVPLALTSTNNMVKRLGAKVWQRLHYGVYPLAILAVAHYWWLVKLDTTQPKLYASVLAGLLLFRVWRIYQK